MVSKVETISNDRTKSCPGNAVIPYMRKVPTKAEIRGSRPLAFAQGRVRRMTAMARSIMNPMVDSRIAIWIT
jgi:hypothetical protein